MRRRVAEGTNSQKEKYRRRAVERFFVLRILLLLYHWPRGNGARFRHLPTAGRGFKSGDGGDRANNANLIRNNANVDFTENNVNFQTENIRPFGFMRNNANVEFTENNANLMRNNANV